MAILASVSLIVNLIFLLQDKENHVVKQSSGFPVRIFSSSRWSKGKSNHDAQRREGNKQQETTESDSNSGVQRVVEVLQSAGATVTPEMKDRLPSWDQVVQLYGEHPVFRYSQKQTCELYQFQVPPERRMLGSAGMFSTGTNLLTTLLKKNCKIPERVALYGVNASRELHGIRWQVPWGKHTQPQYRNQHAATHAKAISKDDILPVITIRHPISWMQSMCKNPYTTKWTHNKHHCPQLHPLYHEQGQEKVNDPGLNIDDAKNDDHANSGNRWNPVTVTYAAGTQTYKSLAHLFNDWYNGYTKHASYPWIMIRMEGMYMDE